MTIAKYKEFNRIVQGGRKMPWYNFKKVWTPLEFMRIYFYKETVDQSLWVKVGKGNRKLLYKK